MKDDLVSSCRTLVSCVPQVDNSTPPSNTPTESRPQTPPANAPSDTNSDFDERITRLRDRNQQLREHTRILQNFSKQRQLFA